jgi:ABC-type nitrate/sulfonate/bicarbonate transport system substrate-binding protein
MVAPLPGASILWSPFIIAVEEGLFEKHGLDVEVISVQSTQTLTFFLTDEFDIGFAVPGTVSALLAQDQPVHVYATILEAINYGFWVQPEITSLDQLRDKIIGVSGVGGLPEQAARALLQEEGYDDTEFTFSALGGIADILTGMIGGSVAAGAFGNPLDGRAAREGLVTLHDISEYELLVAGGPIIADPEWVKENPNSAKAWLRAFFEGMQIALTDQDTTYKVMSQLANLDPVDDLDILEASYGELLRGLPSPEDAADITDVVSYFKDGYSEPDQVPDPNLAIPDADGVLDELIAEGYFECLKLVYGDFPEGSYASKG